MQYVPKWCMLHFSKIKIGSVKPLLIGGNGDLDTLLHTGLKNWFAGSHFGRFGSNYNMISANLGCEPGSHLRTHFLINRLSFFWQTIFAAFVLAGGNQETFVNQCDKQLAYALWRLARYRNCVRSSNITHRA